MLQQAFDLVQQGLVLQQDFAADLVQLGLEALVVVEALCGVEEDAVVRQDHLAAEPFVHRLHAQGGPRVAEILGNENQSIWNKLSIID